MPPVALRPRSTTELIDAAVQLLRQHYVELVTTAALFTIPVIVIRMFVVPAIPVGQLPTLADLRPLAIIALVSFVLGSMSTAASVVIVSDSYLGREVTIAAAIERVLARFWSVLFAAVLYVGAILVGLLFFILPMFIFLAWFFALQNVVMIEGKSAIASMGRSYDLARGSVGRILGTLILAGLIVAIIQGVIGVLLGVVFTPLRGNSTPAAVVSSVIGIFVFPFFSVLITLLYYDLRIRKEGFDLELMAKELGAPAPVTAPA